MEAIERAANISVGRACGFCALAVICLMVGFSYEPHLAARVGGWLSFAITLGLILKAWRALRRPYKTTETWLLLSEEDRPPPEIAQALIGTTLRTVLLRYAQYSALITVVLLTAAIPLAARVA